MTELQLTTFRGKRTKDCQWVVGNYVSAFYSPHVIIAPELDAGGFRIYEVDPTTVSIRVDGIHDKNGNDIFVGDIINVKYVDLDEVFIGEIIYEAKEGRFAVRYLGAEVNCGISRSEIMEVVGNVFDNPELLEVTV